MRSVGLFVVKVGILFALLMAPVPPLERVYSRISRIACAALLNVIDFGAETGCRLNEAGGASDMTVWFSNKATGQRSESAFYSGFLWRAPLFFYVALVLASPVSWRVALRALGIGVPIVLAYILAKLVVLAALGAASSPVRTIDLSSTTVEMLRRAHGILWLQPLFWYLPAIVTWGVYLGPALTSRLAPGADSRPAARPATLDQPRSSPGA